MLASIRTFVLVLAAAWLATGVASAQTFVGTFTLPCEVNWESVTLPAGEYSFRIDPGEGPIPLITIRGENRAAMILPSRGVSDRKVNSESVLILVRRGRTGTVQALHLAQAGRVLFYGPRKDRDRLYAQGPELIQRVPVTASGK
jgi:hypothetical protein